MGSNTFNTINKAARTYYGFGVFVMIFFAILFFIIGLKVASIKEKRSATIMATIINVKNCDNYTQRTKTNKSSSTQLMYKCDLTYEFDVNGVKYVNDAITNSKTKYREGGQIKIEYDPKDPNDNGLDEHPIKYVGYFLLIMSFIFTLSGMWYYFVSKTPGMGVAQGAFNMVGAIKK